MLNVRQEIEKQGFVAAKPGKFSAVCVGVIVRRENNLLKVVFALKTECGLTSFYHRGQQEGDQNADDGDDNQNLHERHPGRTARIKASPSPQDSPRINFHHYSENLQCGGL